MSIEEKSRPEQSSSCDRGPGKKDQLDAACIYVRQCQKPESEFSASSSFGLTPRLRRALFLGKGRYGCGAWCRVSDACYVPASLPWIQGGILLPLAAVSRVAYSSTYSHRMLLTPTNSMRTICIYWHVKQSRTTLPLSTLRCLAIISPTTHLLIPQPKLYSNLNISLANCNINSSQPSMHAQSTN